LTFRGRPADGRVAGGVAPRGPLRTGRDSLLSSGSHHPAFGVAPARGQISAAAAVEVREGDLVADDVGPVDPSRGGVERLPLGVAQGSYAHWSSNIDDCTDPGAATMKINEVGLGGAQFIELLDPADETFPSAQEPFKVVVYDGAGARTRSAPRYSRAATTPNHSCCRRRQPTAPTGSVASRGI